MLEVEHMKPTRPVKTRQLFSRRKKYVSVRINTHPFAILPKGLILDNSVDLCKQRVVATTANICPGVNLGAHLTDQNVAGLNFLTAEPFYSAPLPFTVAAVS